eukprot:TRINITY_DN433_c0_g1_i1.p1 TRINITY_DN433_c0_g1~~TRINITY_DN433_c0_g1_i1.p1  ORF type:complete len:253 (-),score=61.77 TRINITY_DN433_c0_g1_i1:114-872(-)
MPPKQDRRWHPHQHQPQQQHQQHNKQQQQQQPKKQQQGSGNGGNGEDRLPHQQRQQSDGAPATAKRSRWDDADFTLASTAAPPAEGPSSSSSSSSSALAKGEPQPFLLDRTKPSAQVSASRQPAAEADTDWSERAVLLTGPTRFELTKPMVLQACREANNRAVDARPFPSLETPTGNRLRFAVVMPNRKRASALAAMKNVPLFLEDLKYYLAVEMFTSEHQDVLDELELAAEEELDEEDDEEEEVEVEEDAE